MTVEKFVVTFCHNCDGGMQEFNTARDSILQVFPDAEVEADRRDEYPIWVSDLPLSHFKLYVVGGCLLDGGSILFLAECPFLDGLMIEGFVLTYDQAMWPTVWIADCSFSRFGFYMYVGHTFSYKLNVQCVKRAFILNVALLVGFNKP